MHGVRAQDRALSPPIKKSLLHVAFTIPEIQIHPFAFHVDPKVMLGGVPLVLLADSLKLMVGGQAAQKQIFCEANTVSWHKEVAF